MKSFPFSAVDARYAVTHFSLFVEFFMLKWWVRPRVRAFCFLLSVVVCDIFARHWLMLPWDVCDMTSGVQRSQAEVGRSHRFVQGTTGFECYYCYML